MDFEYDPAKSASNKLKHGIDFNEAQLLWNDLNRIEIPARISDETRVVIIGKIQNKHWAAVITYRERRIRIISVRRARENERDIYES